MPADWTPPITWNVDRLVTNTDLNKQVRDNLLFLKDPPTGEYTPDETSNYTTNSTSFVDVDATNLALEIETAGGDVMVHFHGVVFHSSGAGSGKKAYFDVDVDGSRIGNDDGIAVGTVSSGDPQTDMVSFTRLITGLEAGSHTFKLQWKVSAGTQGLYAGAGTANGDLHPQFWAREVS